jgi:hypothetical protein
MYGITMEGNSVLCHIHGFVPYFFIPAPSNMKKDDCHAFKDALNRVVLADMRSNKDMVVQVITVEPCYTEFYYLEAPRPHFGGNSGAGGKNLAEVHGKLGLRNGQCQVHVAYMYQCINEL